MNQTAHAATIPVEMTSYGHGSLPTRFGTRSCGFAPTIYPCQISQFL